MFTDRYRIEPAPAPSAAPRHGGRLPIFSPLFALTVTVEKGSGEGDEVHTHPGGQGFWIARMLRHLGQQPLLCAPVGGEIGAVLVALVAEWGIDLDPVEISATSPTTVQDRRSGSRRRIADTPPPILTRHERDDLYDTFLDQALGSQVCVVTGHPGTTLPTETYRRLGHDLASSGGKVVADIHGEQLDSFLEGGALDVLKVSSEDLTQDGLLARDDEPATLATIQGLVSRGARAVVVSRAERPALAALEGGLFKIRMPDLKPADTRGAGDSMTAGLATALSMDMGIEDTLRLASGAGAANVTRHGLGSAPDDLIAKLADRVQVDALSTSG